MKCMLRIVPVLILIALGNTVSAQNSSTSLLPFDHGNVGFELDMAHTFVPCESCHVDGQFQGTPTECALCHSVNTPVNATAKPVSHLASSDDCATCHTDTAWENTVFVDHDQVLGDCVTCHDGTTAEGRSLNHVETSEACDSCHLNSAWSPASFSHQGIVDGCVTCHDGSTADGKTLDHIQTTDSCESCP
ncbi:MAG: cytochrome c3 family protein [Gammaproteobacteria bacterium]